MLGYDVVICGVGKFTLIRKEGMNRACRLISSPQALAAVITGNRQVWVAGGPTKAGLQCGCTAG